MKKILLTLCVLSSSAYAELVPKASIDLQKKLTSTTKLKNNIPVLLRSVPSSDILVIDVTIKTGSRDLDAGKKSLNNILFKSLANGSKNYPKEKLFEILEKNTISLACDGGIEHSHCVVIALTDQLDLAANLIADAMIHPNLNEKDVNVVRSRLIAEQKAVTQNPDRFVNETANTIFYPKGHPYRHLASDAVGELNQLTISDITNYHKSILNSQAMQVVVVSSLTTDKLKTTLDKHFHGIPSVKVTRKPVSEPKLTQNYIFADRAIPSAYIKAKFNLPGMKHADAPALKLLFEMLSEELGDEIRTKRSLSYAVYAAPIQHSIGIGFLSASTSKPKETLEAMKEVLEKFKNKTYSKEQLEEYRTVFATNYYLTLESHASLAEALATSFAYFNSANELYDLPTKLDKITPETITKLARKYLTHFRTAVLFERSQFKDEWIKNLTQF